MGFGRLVAPRVQPVRPVEAGFGVSAAGPAVGSQRVTAAVPEVAPQAGTNLPEVAPRGSGYGDEDQVYYDENGKLRRRRKRYGGGGGGGGMAEFTDGVELPNAPQGNSAAIVLYLSVNSASASYSIQRWLGDITFYDTIAVPSASGGAFVALGVRPSDRSFVYIDNGFGLRKINADGSLAFTTTSQFAAATIGSDGKVYDVGVGAGGRFRRYNETSGANEIDVAFSGQGGVEVAGDPTSATRLYAYTVPLGGPNVGHLYTLTSAGVVSSDSIPDASAIGNGNLAVDELGGVFMVGTRTGALMLHRPGFASVQLWPGILSTLDPTAQLLTYGLAAANGRLYLRVNDFSDPSTPQYLVVLDYTGALIRTISLGPTSGLVYLAAAAAGA